jgi:surface protein
MKEIIVDSDDPETIAIFAPVITILRAGEFTLIAETNAGKFTLIGGTVPTVEFRASQPIYRKFNVLKATATFVPWYLFPDDPDNPLLAGQRRTFNPPVFITPNPIPYQMNPSNFTYESSASLIASVETSIVNGSRVLTAVINRIGQFQIVASIPETDNYNAIRVYSENEYPTSINRPIIRFPTKPAPTKVITFGDTYTIVPAYFYYPRLSMVELLGLYVTHFIRNSGDFRVLPGTSPDYIQTVQILSAGTFRIYAETNPVENVFEKTYIYLNVTVNRATPIITFPGSIFPGQTVLIVGTSYDFLPAVVTVPGITDTTILPQIRYKTNDASVATITTVLTPEGEIRRINILRPSTTPITITAYTEATTNFTATETVYSNQRSVYYNTPDITVPSINNIINNTLTFGQQPQPTFQLAVVTNPASGSNLHRTISIQYAIVHESEDNTLRNDVATISGTTITLLSSGRFRIRARTVATSIFRSFSRFTTVVTVNRATPTFLEPWNPIPNVLFIGDTANIIAPQITLPIPAHMDEIFPITYRYNTGGIVTITPLQPTLLVSSVRINNIGRFRLTATTTQSVRYNAITIPSPTETATTRRRPVIVFPISFIRNVTFGQTYNFFQPTFDGTPNPAADGVTITYTIENPSRADVPVATASGTSGQTITINNVGHFYILATTNATLLFDSVIHPPSPRVTVIPATPTFPSTVWDAFPSGITTFFVGDTVTIAPPPQLTFPSVALQQANGIRIVYIIGNNESEPINGPTFTRIFAGRFDIRAETRSNGNYNNARIDSTRIINFINRPPPRIVLNGETLVFQELSLPNGSPTFIQASPRGFPEWFAVVDNRSREAITNYARGVTGPFTHAGQLVPFNNIVTTLMTDMSVLFDGITNFNQNIASWDTGRVTIMAAMFRSASAFNRPIGNWNTVGVTNMSNMFSLATAFNQGIGNWNTARVTEMTSMFQGAINFSQAIGGWNTSAVREMSFMFFDATAFNSPLSWNTSAVRSMAVMFMRAASFNRDLILNTQSLNNMNSMFSGATSFQGFGNIGAWNTSQVTSMNSTFQGARSFSQSLGWNTSLVLDMNNMFNAATAYNGNMYWWDTSRVTIMAGMFGGATSFNQGIGRWNTSQVTNMGQMFDGATNFNQPINTNGLSFGAWNTSAVTNMSFMFRNAQQFNQNIGGWNTSRVTDMQHMFDGATNFNNGERVTVVNVYMIFGPVVTGFLTQDEANRFFRPMYANISLNNDAWALVTPRQTMNWNTMNVRNFNFMFNEASNFLNVDLRRWTTMFGTTVAFRRNSPMVEPFMPWNAWIFSPNRGR